MFFSKIAASVAALAVAASAAPLTRIIPRDDVPATENKDAFRLVVKVTAGTDFADSPANNGQVTLYHTGAAQNRAVVSNSVGAVFYQNGTQAEADSWTARLVNDTPSFPQGFLIDFEGAGTDTFDVNVNVGPGSQSIMVSTAKDLAFIDRHGATDDGATTGTFVVCQDASLGNVLSWKTTNGAPDGCVAVDLVPECDTLPALPAGADWNHDFVQEVRCYANVAAIAWSHST